MAVVKVPVALGGTGADNAADARANLGISSNTSGGAYSGIFVSNAQIKSSNVSGNVTINTGNVMLSKAGANVTFESPGTTVVGAQFKTPGIHDLATQRVITLKSNNYSANRLLDYRVPTINIKAKYNNVAINTAGRVLFANRFDDEASMPKPNAYEGLITYDRTSGGPGKLLVANALNRHTVLIANADIIPGTNITYSIGTTGSQWTTLRVANDVIAGSNVKSIGGLEIGGDSIVVNQHTGFVGIGTSSPLMNLDIRGNTIIHGNLTVKGNTYIVDTKHLIVDDPVIELGANIAQGSAPTLDIGILMNRGSASNSFLGYDESRDEMATAFTADPSGVTTITIAGYTPFRANSAIFAVEGDTKKTNFSKVAIGTASPGPYKLDVRGNANVGAMAVSSLTLDTDLAVAHGGTGASSFTDGGVLLGSGTSAITAMGVLTDGQMIVGDGTTDPVAESGATLRTSVGVGTGDTPQFYGANVSGNASINRSLAVGYVDGRVPQANLDVAGNVYITGKTTHASYSHFPDDVKVLWGHDPTGVVSDLEMYHGGTHSFIKNKTGDLRIKSDSILLKNQADDETYLDANNGGSIDLYFDNTKKLETTGTGVIVSGLGANLAGNTSVSRSLAVGYTAHRVPQANLDVKGNAYVTGAMSINDGEAVASEGLALAYAIALG